MKVRQKNILSSIELISHHLRWLWFGIYLQSKYIADWLACKLILVKSGFKYHIGAPAFKVRPKTTYFSNSSLTASPIFSKIYGLLMYLPSPRIRKVAMCGPAVYGGLQLVLFEEIDGFKG